VDWRWICSHCFGYEECGGANQELSAIHVDRDFHFGSWTLSSIIISLHTPNLYPPKAFLSCPEATKPKIAKDKPIKQADKTLPTDYRSSDSVIIHQKNAPLTRTAHYTTDPREILVTEVTSTAVCDNSPLHSQSYNRNEESQAACGDWDGHILGTLKPF
jgi:hypothetical protein